MVKHRCLRKSTIEVQPQSNVDVKGEHQSLSEEHVKHNTNQLHMQSDSNEHSLPATDPLVHVSPTNSNEPSTPTKKRGPTLLSDIFNQPLTERIIVRFNNRGQTIGSEGCVLASFLGIVARDPIMSPLNFEDWRAFPRHEKKELLKFVKKRSAINRINRAKQTMAHTAGSKSFARLMAEKEMILEKLSQTPNSIEQPPGSVAWEATDETVQKLKDEMKLMEQKHVDELNDMKSELKFFRACMSKIFPSEFGISGSSGASNGTSRLNETTNKEVHDACSPLDKE
ncbi:uncharacterized protein LOC119979805 [Tripterygium wilfordii]|uniref:uncharacterized protein LOC119979805 n=1 Tax=Tripterygium wilfordii TaxID=458696 RepID=UPI0018F82F1B|nr:uncharacterized protein LOC119979805 [Tripterygium wilfordii]